MGEPVYLGDSVYAQMDGVSVRLYLDNGLGAHSEIYLEPAVYSALCDFVNSATANHKGVVENSQD